MAVAQAAIQAPIVDDIAQAQRVARRDFLWKFSLTWAVIIAALGLVIYATGNADPAFTIEWGPFILGGVGDHHRHLYRLDRPGAPSWRSSARWGVCPRTRS